MCKFVPQDPGAFAASSQAAIGAEASAGTSRSDARSLSHIFDVLNSFSHQDCVCLHRAGKPEVSLHVHPGKVQSSAGRAHLANARLWEEQQGLLWAPLHVGPSLVLAVHP